MPGSCTRPAESITCALAQGLQQIGRVHVMRRNTGFQLAILTAALLTASGFAQEAQQPQPQGPPEPGHGVARLSLVNGEVSVRRGDAGDWVAAVANAPVGVN